MYACFYHIYDIFLLYRIFLSYNAVEPWNNAGLRDANMHTVENLPITFDSPKTKVTPRYYPWGTESGTSCWITTLVHAEVHNIKWCRMDTVDPLHLYIPDLGSFKILYCFVYAVVQSTDAKPRDKEDQLSLCIFLKHMYKWIHAMQTYVFEGSTVIISLNFILSLINFPVPQT